jgi:hypothetical protein
MFKLIGLIVAAMPVFLFLRSILKGRLKRSEAISNFKKQVDFAVWAIIILVSCGFVFSLGKLIYDLRFAGP